MIAFFYWDPSRAVVPWNIPLLNRPILWYGFLFALGFLCAYGIVLHLLRQEKSKVEAKKIADSLTFYVIMGTVIGARLFDVIFYENLDVIVHDPLSIFRVWEGGLASHGGALGIVVALILFQKRHKFCSWYRLLDLLALVAGLAGFFIRLGNFFNQEILGKPTDLPWAVTFGHPADGSFPVPRHPVQLYEAFFYLGVFILLWFLRGRWKEGRTCGLFLVLVFTFRFFIEFLKEEQSWLFLESPFPLTMGQLLSIPFIIWGLWLLLREKFRKER